MADMNGHELTIISMLMTTGTTGAKDTAVVVVAAMTERAMQREKTGETKKDQGELVLNTPSIDDLIHLERGKAQRAQFRGDR